MQEDEFESFDINEIYKEYQESPLKNTLFMIIITSIFICPLSLSIFVGLILISNFFEINIFLSSSVSFLFIVSIVVFSIFSTYKMYSDKKENANKELNDRVLISELKKAKPIYKTEFIQYYDLKNYVLLIDQLFGNKILRKNEIIRTRIESVVSNKFRTPKWDITIISKNDKDTIRSECERDIVIDVNTDEIIKLFMYISTLSTDNTIKFKYFAPNEDKDKLVQKLSNYFKVEK